MATRDWIVKVHFWPDGNRLNALSEDTLSFISEVKLLDSCGLSDGVHGWLDLARGSELTLHGTVLGEYGGLQSRQVQLFWLHLLQNDTFLSVKLDTKINLSLARLLLILLLLHKP